jgi:8-oxo-dGTP pyrophosphatase MutT (NUDIX family)
MSTQPVQPVDASTVILVREGVPTGEPWQTFMVRRHIESDFAADVFVFPGGKVDMEDRDPELLALIDGHPIESERGPGLAEWKSLRMAAIRELFEEAGVLLARDRSDRVVDLMGEQADRFDRYRRMLQAGAVTMVEMAREEGLRYIGDALHPFSRWITPTPFSRRFDTRFFVALAPPRQMPIHDRAETTASVWIDPEEALAQYEEGTFPLVFATEQHLERMSEFRSIDEMIAATQTADLTPVMPKVIERDGEQGFLLPGDEGYETGP